jgi:hypothetical protein
MELELVSDYRDREPREVKMVGEIFSLGGGCDYGHHGGYGGYKHYGYGGYKHYGYGGYKHYGYGKRYYGYKGGYKRHYGGSGGLLGIRLGGGY